MKLTFRVLAVAAIIAGLGFGVSFGAGYAVGRGDPKTVSGGLTTAQLTQLLGAQTAAGLAAQSGAGASGTPASGQQRTGAQAGTGTQAGAGGAGALSGLTAITTALGRTPTGRVTAVEGNTVTIETRQGTQTASLKLNISAATIVSRSSVAAAADLKVGDTVVVAGARKDDGSFDASSVSLVPTELLALVNALSAGLTQSGR